MNKTKIEWTDYTWNPVTGCWGPGGTIGQANFCPYCYARKIASRFTPGGKENMGHDCTQPNIGPFGPWEKRYKRGFPWLYGFEPTFHSYRLGEPKRIKKPSKIFVCSMADLFGDWVPREWIEAILNRTQRADYSHHIYQFLTKNPKRLQEFNPWPSNCWVGTTVTNQTDADERLPWILRVEASVRFVSHEPLLEAINMYPQSWLLRNCEFEVLYPCHGVQRPGVHWAIIGGMTGPGAIETKSVWVRNLINQYQDAKIPIFIKDNLKWPEKIQEAP